MPMLQCGKVIVIANASTIASFTATVIAIAS